MRISYKLAKRTKKTEKIGKSLIMVKMYNIINITTVCDKLIASKNIIHAIPNYKVMERSASYGYLKNKKNQK